MPTSLQLVKDKIRDAKTLICGNFRKNDEGFHLFIKRGTYTKEELECLITILQSELSK